MRAGRCVAPKAAQPKEKRHKAMENALEKLFLLSLCTRLQQWSEQAVPQCHASHRLSRALLTREESSSTNGEDMAAFKLNRWLEKHPGACAKIPHSTFHLAKCLEGISHKQVSKLSPHSEDKSLSIRFTFTPICSSHCGDSDRQHLDLPASLQEQNQSKWPRLEPAPTCSSRPASGVEQRVSSLDRSRMESRDSGMKEAESSSGLMGLRGEWVWGSSEWEWQLPMSGDAGWGVKGFPSWGVVRPSVDL